MRRDEGTPGSGAGSHPGPSRVTRREPGAIDARHEFALPMFRVVHRRDRHRWTVVRATPTTFGIIGRLLTTAVIVLPLLGIVSMLARIEQDVDGQFNAFFWVVFPSLILVVLLFVPPLWQPGRRRRKRPAPGAGVSRLGTRSSSSRSAPR